MGLLPAGSHLPHPQPVHAQSQRHLAQGGEKSEQSTKGNFHRKGGAGVCPAPHPLKVQGVFKFLTKKNVRTRPAEKQEIVLSERSVDICMEVAVSDFRFICMNSQTFVHSFNLTYLT